MTGSTAPDPRTATHPGAARESAAACPDHRSTTPAVVVATLALAVLSGLTVWAWHGDGGNAATRRLLLDVAAAVVAVALVPVLLRRPVRGALLLAVVAALSPAATPPATLGTLQVAERRSLRTALLVAAAGVAGHAVQGLWRPPSGLAYGWWLVLVLVAHAGLVGWGAWVQGRRQVLAALRERAERAEAAQEAAAERAREQERERIAREMHDVLAHRLSLLATWAGALEYRPDAPPERLAQAAGTLRTGIHQALDELREVVGMLRHPDGHPDGHAAGQPDGHPGGQPDRPTARLADLPDLVAESRDAGTPVDLRLDLPTPDTAVHADGTARTAAAPGPGVAVDRAAYRVVQEALTNARKHAPGRPVRVSVTGAPDRGIDIEVVNPLPDLPPPPGPSSGAGLVGLTERATLAGGTLTHGTEPAGDDDGTVFAVRCWLPWRHGDDGAGPGRR